MSTYEIRPGTLEIMFSVEGMADPQRITLLKLLQTQSHKEISDGLSYVSMKEGVDLEALILAVPSTVTAAKLSVRSDAWRTLCTSVAHYKRTRTWVWGAEGRTDSDVPLPFTAGLDGSIAAVEAAIKRYCELSGTSDELMHSYFTIVQRRIDDVDADLPFVPTDEARRIKRRVRVNGRTRNLFQRANETASIAVVVRARKRRG